MTKNMEFKQPARAKVSITSTPGSWCLSPQTERVLEGLVVRFLSVSEFKIKVRGSFRPKVSCQTQAEALALHVCLSITTSLQRPRG